MSLPIDLILVRHGQSEGNIATKASENGDNSLFTEAFLNRHSREFRLTDLGVEQAQMAGKWIKENVGEEFGRYCVSEYIRAKETAYNLGLNNANWRVEFNLRERDLALMDNIPRDQRKEMYGLEHKQYKLDSFFSYPAGGGESVAAMCLRVKTGVLEHLARNCPDKKVIVVNHGHIMRGCQIEIEGLGRDDFVRLDKSNDLADKIRNCQILWYTRRDPCNPRVISSRMLAVRSVCPWAPEGDYGWRYIERKTFSNEDLRSEVQKYKRQAS